MPIPPDREASGNDKPRIRKFNPGTLQSDDEVIAQFVVRDAELEGVLETLRQNVDAPCCQNLLVVGPRGSGKTMLLARAAAEIRRDRGLSERLQPVRLMEENPEVFDFGEFWLEVLFQLDREISAARPDVAATLRDSRDDLLRRWRPELAQEALGVVLEGARLLDRRLVLFVENMQDLCRDTEPDFGWQVRGTLQSDPRVMLVGSATTLFDELQDVNSAFFELFRFMELKPLKSAACLRLWQAICGDKATRRHIRPLEILTGGSPRLLVIMAEFARHRSMRELMEELVALVDTHTEYFRNRMDRLPKGERRVYAAVLDLWEPSTTGEVAGRARMEGRAVSTCLGRLVNRGMLAVEGGGRNRRYSAAERLYNIYYKLRRERDEAGVVSHLIRFMVAFYGKAELTEFSADLVGQPQPDDVWKGVVGAIRDQPDFAAVVGGEVVGALFAAMENREFDHASTLARRALDREELQPLVRAFAALVVGWVRQNIGTRNGELGAAVATLERIVSEFDETDGLRDLVNGAPTVNGAAYGPFRIEATDSDVIERHAPWAHEVIALSVTLSHLALGHLLWQTGRLEGAASRYETLAREFGTSTRPMVQDQVATALLRLGDLYGRHLDDDRSAVSAWDRAVQTLRRQVARSRPADLGRALLQRAHALGRLGIEQDVRDWDTVIAQLPDPAQLECPAALSEAMAFKGVALARKGDLEKAEKVWRNVLELFGATTDREVRFRVRMAKVLIGMAQARTDRADEAWEIAETLEQDADESTDWEILWHVRRLKVTVRLAQDRLTDALHEFRAAYKTFAGGRATINEMLGLVGDAVACGVGFEELIEVLSTDSDKAARLAPLITALMLESDSHGVRAPSEVLDVAQDIRADFRRRSTPGHRIVQSSPRRPLHS